MIDKINWKKFGNAFFIILIGLLLFDMVWDAFISHKILWAEIFGPRNLIYKTATSVIGSYFYATSDTENPPTTNNK